MKFFQGLKIYVFALSLTMVGVSGYFLINPTSVQAATCSAKCSNGIQTWSVKCTGNKSCSASDYTGCFSDTEWKLCDGTSGKVPSDEFEPESQDY